MNYLRLLYAIFIGALMTVTTRFGPSLTIFAFVYLSRYSMEQEYSVDMTVEQWVYYLLPIASILVGIFAFVVRIALKAHSTKWDRNVMHFVDYLVLRHVEKGSMTTVALRGQSVLALRITQTFLLLLILSLAISVIAPELSILSICLIGFIVTLAFINVNTGVTTASFGKIVAKQDSIIEQTMIVAMVIGCVIFVPREKWLHAAIGLFVIARFISSYRILGKSILQWVVVRQMKPFPLRPLPVPKPPKILKPAALRATSKTAPPIAAPAPKPD